MSLAKHFVVQKKNDVTTEIGICDQSNQGLIVPRPVPTVPEFGII